MLGFLVASFALPFAHRFGRRPLRRAVIMLSVLTVLLMAVFAMREPFDAMHQKRLFVIHSQNVGSADFFLFYFKIN